MIERERAYVRERKCGLGGVGDGRCVVSMWGGRRGERSSLDCRRSVTAPGVSAAWQKINDSVDLLYIEITKDPHRPGKKDDDREGITFGMALCAPCL